MNQVANDPTVKPPAAKASLTDLVSNDTGNTDRGDIQYVLFNLVAFVYVSGTLLYDPTKGLPHIPDVLLGHTSVSALGYVGKKALVPTGLATATAQPTKGGVNTQVTIAVTGLTPPTQTAAPLWVRFADNPGESIKVSITGGNTQIELKAPQVDPAPQDPIPITVITGNGTVISAGTFTYE